MENRKILLLLLSVLFAFVHVNSQSLNILSLNNSLIDYNNQPALFNEMAKAMGKKAQWDARTQLGRTLLYHYNDAVSHGLAMSGNWDYVILQEQSSLPRHYPEIFLKSVELWKRAIMEKEGGVHTKIILPMNWPYSDDWPHFKESIAKLKSVYRDACRDMPGVIVCPVAVAYEQLFDNDGAEACASLYTDNRHPSLKASYLAACMEYAVIFGESPLNVAYVPDGLPSAEASAMRKLADVALAAWEKEMKKSR